MIRCAACHRPMKHESASGYGPRCEVKRKGARSRVKANAARKHSKQSADPRQIEFAFQEVR